MSILEAITSMDEHVGLTHGSRRWHMRDPWMTR